MRRQSRRQGPGPLRWWAALAAVAMVCGPATARANGRYPRSERVIEDPSNADHLLVAATYGLVTTSDRGGHWYHVCEAAFADSPGYVGDPLLDLVAGGALLVDVQSSIHRSADGCAWTPTLGFPAGVHANIGDLAVNPLDRATVVAVVSLLVDGGVRISLEQSDDAGLTWRAIGTPLPLSSVDTIDLDPTDATHIHATGLAPLRDGDMGAFLTSLDHGMTWTSVPIPNTDSNDVPYIAAIDPLDPDKIFVRTDAVTLPADGSEEVANDALLYSADGGATWTELLRESAKLLGFALSPDGTTVLAGYGDPFESGIYVDPTVTGVYEAQTSDMSFSHVVSGSVTGLTWTVRGVYASEAQPVSGSSEEVAFFSGGDLAPDGAAPISLMKLDDVEGPPPCCAAVDSVCNWQAVCLTYQFFSCGDGGPPAVRCADAGAPADASIDGTAAGDASARSADATVSPADGAAEDAPAAASGGGSGCGCRVTASRDARDARGNGSRLATLVAAAAAAAVVARRNRTGQRHGARLKTTRAARITEKSRVEEVEIPCPPIRVQATSLRRRSSSIS
jgi:hypothetical protein